MESHSINVTPQLSNYATQAATLQITNFTDTIGDDIKNIFLLHISINTNISRYWNELYLNNYKGDNDTQKLHLLETLDLQMPIDMPLYSHQNDRHIEVYVAQYLNEIPSIDNEWAMYKASDNTSKQTDMNLNYIHASLDLQGIYIPTKGKITDELAIMMYSQRAFDDVSYCDDNVDIYTSPLNVEHGLFEDPLEYKIIEYLIKNYCLCDLDTKIEQGPNQLNFYDELQMHLYITHCANNDCNYAYMMHIQHASFSTNTTHNNINTMYTSSSNQYCTSITTLLDISTYTEALHTHINSLVLDTLCLPKYNVTLHNIFQHIHKYKTNKVRFNAYMYGRIDHSVLFKGS